MAMSAATPAGANLITLRYYERGVFFLVGSIRTAGGVPLVVRLVWCSV
jgi:hypothetical protein